MIRDNYELIEFKKYVKTRLGKENFITLYASEAKVDKTENVSFFSALADKDNEANYMQKYTWDMQVNGGNPGLSFTWDNNGKQHAEYHRFYSLEPLVYYRSFYGLKDKYLELSEEFRLYFNLYEEITSKNTRKYIHIDDVGDDEDVAYIEANLVKVKLSFLKKYLSIRNKVLLLFIEVMSLTNDELNNIGIKESEETEKGDDYHFNHLIRSLDVGTNKSQSWFIGKKVIRGLKDYVPTLEESDDRSYCEFIIGTDEDGLPITNTCDEEQLSNYFGKNKGKPHYLTPVFFKKEVMQKYYNNPHKYEVSDGYLTCKGLWDLRIDNNNPNHVMVYLGDLGKIGEKEQIYWKSFNIIISSGGISGTAWKRDFQGEFADPDELDLYFKMIFDKFQKDWFKKYSWHLFKPLSKNDLHYFKSLHNPRTDNQKEFDEQILSLVKILIDSLNEQKLEEGLTIAKNNPKGIDKLEAFMIENNVKQDNIIEFFRMLQTLRSTSIAHRKSDNNRDYKKVKTYFNMENNTLPKVFDEILEKSISAIKYLEKQLI